MPDEDNIPAFLFDAVMDIMENQAKETLKAYEEHLEVIKYDHAKSRAHQVLMYEIIIQILDHPKGGPEVAKKALREQIKLIKEIDKEDD
jgi:hypothetical protein